MTRTVFGKKIGMGECYLGDTRTAATQIQLYSATVSQLKTKEKDGYVATQIAFATPKKKVSQALAGHLKAAGLAKAQTAEVAYTDGDAVGAVISPASVLQVGSVVAVTGVSKGKGRAGVVKLHGFAGGPRTHGQSDRLRRAGSIGQGTTPGRVYKGKKMAGRMGSDTVTMKNALVVAFDSGNNVVWVTGPVPGHRDTLVRLEVTGTKDNVVATYISGKGAQPQAAAVVEAPASAPEKPTETGSDEGQTV
jgi:large subunit ribosomal protein L3